VQKTPDFFEKDQPGWFQCFIRFLVLLDIRDFFLFEEAVLERFVIKEFA